MKNLLNEEIERISDLMGVKSKKDVLSKLNNLKYWLYDSNGLGLQKIIEDNLSDIKSGISQEDMEKYTRGVDLLRDNGKISDRVRENFINNLSSRKLVYVDGKWHPVNKLNTNYSDIAELLTDLLFESLDDNQYEFPKEIIEFIVNTNDESKIKDILSKYKQDIPNLFESYLKTPEKLLTYTKNIIRNSDYGAKMEDDVLDKLKGMGYTEEYKGGDGDFIDMIFSTDLIVKTPKGEIKTIQVKSTESQGIKFIQDQKNGKHGAVDILIYPYKGKFRVHILKNNLVKDI
jgi:hypothetical protein